MLSQAPRRETEIKLAVPDAGRVRRRLAELGFRVIRRRTLQSDLVLDTADGALRRRGLLLRLRRDGARTHLTYKGPPLAGRHKSREEIEVELDAPTAAAFQRILSRLGYRAAFRYEKYRTAFAASRGGGVVALDETPIGVFLEIEGRPAWIDRTARRLGYRPSDYITATYAELYWDFCRRAGKKPGHMVFPRAAGS